MRLKTALFFIVIGVLGIVFTSFFAGSVLMGKVVAPFGSISQNTGPATSEGISSTQFEGNQNVQFVDADLEKAWIPWLIKQISILIGAISLAIFVYAGLMLIIHGDSEEQFTTSVKMLVYGVIGIALAAFSYTIIANLLTFFT